MVIPVMNRSCRYRNRNRNQKATQWSEISPDCKMKEGANDRREGGMDGRVERRARWEQPTERFVVGNEKKRRREDGGADGDKTKSKSVNERTRVVAEPRKKSKTYGLDHVRKNQSV
ncbi:hypothetical protein FRC14_001547 [Serendipita sp. 396]|nr:hypothetical protein FRC14_001547 [Serendipita sp. 396]